ncbi:MAG: type I-U CRISPR-associated protein Cas8c [Candidatus Baltobacteraceae bacterium]|jgi:CRISPR-associated protein Csx14
MGSSTIPVDLLNPGQVMAALGLAEAAESLLGGEVLSAFLGDAGTTQAEFCVESGNGADSVREVIEFLRSATVAAVVPTKSDLSTKEWNVEEVKASGLVSPSPVPRAPATLPALLQSGGRSITLSSWADGAHCGLDNVKFWAGSQGKPGAAFAQDMLKLIQQTDTEQCLSDPFSCATPMSGSFRFDWRRDYIPLDAGFSPNKHKKTVTMVGFPFTEILAAIGLRHARPQRIDKLHYRYGVWSRLLPNVLARPMLGAVDIGVPARTFRMTLGWPGKEGQARCIIDAREEILPWNR